MKIISGILLSVLLSTMIGCTTTSSTSVSRNPSLALDDYVNLGLGYLNRGERDLARSNIQRALNIDSRSASANHAMAMINQSEGEYVAAEANYRKAISTDPAFSQARTNYATFLMSLNRFKDARDQYQIVSEDLSYRLRPQVFVSLGVAERELGNYAEARVAFEKALRLNPDLAVAWLEMADIEVREGNYVEANLYMDKMVGVPPTARSLYLGVQIQRQLGDRDREASYALALKNLFPDSPEAKLLAE